MPRHRHSVVSQISVALQVSLQVASQAQLQVSRFASRSGEQARSSASHAQPQASLSNTKPGAQVAFSTHSQAQVSVLQVSKPPQVALQSRAHSGSQVSRLQVCCGDGRPPQSVGQMHWAFRQMNGGGQSPQGSLFPSGFGERSIHVRYETAMSFPSAGRQSPMNAMELLAAS
jgi:hypothetical protein